jgi:ATP-binding cassette subfamily B protein
LNDSTERRNNALHPSLAILAPHLDPGERILASFRLDLDPSRAFREGIVALTERRLIAMDDLAARTGFRAWPLEAVTGLTATDRGGLGTLEALGADGLLGRWHYTLGRAKGVASVLDVFAGLRAERQVPSATAGQEADLEVPETVQPEEPPRVGTLFRLLRFARPHLAWLALGLCLTLTSTAAGLIPPLLTWPLVDDIFAPYQEQVKIARDDPTIGEVAREARLESLREKAHEPFAMVPWYLLGMIGSGLAAWGLGWGQGWVLARLSERISADLRNTTYAHVHSLSLDYFSAKRTGDLVTRISTDSDRICYFLSDTLTDFTADALMIVGTAAMLFYMDPLLAAATLCTFPGVAWLTYTTRTRLSEGFARGYRAWDEMTSILSDTIPGVRVVKAFAQERREVERFKASNDRIVAANDRVNRVWTFFWPMVAMLNQMGLVVAWAFGAWRVFDQVITVGVLTAFLAYIARFYGRLESMTRMAGSTQRAAASAQRIFEVLDRAPSVAEPANPVSPGRLKGEVELRNVGFRFGNRRILDDVSITIRPGEMVGVVGPTGAGKTTLLNLICRFYDVTDGSILVDGKDIRSFPTLEYRRNIGIVLQDPFLFYGTIAENIAYGRPAASHDEIIAAARAARAHEFILQLPDGYDSIVGERGQTLSGGERQRISIARALLIDPRLLILDEATSSVDTQTEIQIQEALDNLVRGRTTLAIAHRLSTLRNADRIVVLDGGRIVETGSHEQLIAADGLYRSLYEAQSRHEMEHPGEGAPVEPLPPQALLRAEPSRKESP